jgi:hypothetical protein
VIEGQDDRECTVFIFCVEANLFGVLSAREVLINN